MKKTYRIASALLAVLMAAGLFAGCSEKPADNTPAQPDTPAVVEPADPGVTDEPVAGASQLEGVYTQIEALNVLPEMYMLGDAYVESYYGISADSIDDKVFAVADDSLLADTIIIVKVSANGDASAIEGTFKTINDQKKLELESYNPEQYDRVCDAVIKTSGSYVYYIVSDDNDAVAKIIEGAIG